VHEWCLRHIFVELRHYGGASSGIAIFGTFAFSAVFHGTFFCLVDCLSFVSRCAHNFLPASGAELLFSVAFKTFRPWFFLGMLVQLVRSNPPSASAYYAFLTTGSCCNYELRALICFSFTRLLFLLAGPVSNNHPPHSFTVISSLHPTRYHIVLDSTPVHEAPNLS
jgi:hypothetical protein